MKKYTKSAFISYPDAYPQPTIGGYSFNYVQNSVSHQMQCGWVRKRQLTDYPIRNLQLSFQMSAKEFREWHKWVHANAFVWMEMKLQTDRTAASLENLSTEVIRFTTGVSWQYTDWNVINASVGAEIEEDAVINVPVDPGTDAGIDEI